MQEFWKKSAFSGVLLIKTAALKQTKKLKKNKVFFQKKWSKNLEMSKIISNFAA